MDLYIPFQSVRWEVLPFPVVDLDQTYLRHLTWLVPLFDWMSASDLLNNTRKALSQVFIFFFILLLLS